MHRPIFRASVKLRLHRHLPPLSKAAQRSWNHAAKKPRTVDQLIRRWPKITRWRNFCSISCIDPGTASPFALGWVLGSSNRTPTYWPAQKSRTHYGQTKSFRTENMVRLEQPWARSLDVSAISKISSRVESRLALRKSSSSTRIFKILNSIFGRVLLDLYPILD